MGKFTRKVEFNAYQFNPEALQGKEDWEIDDIIIDALALGDGVKSAFINDQGNLDLVIYTYGGEESKAYYEIKPGDWLTNIPRGKEFFTPFTDAEFWKMATAVR
jgi:hypothetical protein